MGEDVCYCELVREIGHEILRSFLKLTEERITDPESPPDHISRSRWMEICSAILMPIEHLRRLMSEERYSFVLLPPSELEKVVDTLSNPEKTDEMVREMFRLLGFRIDEISEYQMLHARLSIKMYLLMEITWAHQNLVRHPAHPTAANLPAHEAAEENVWTGGMGFNHYSDEIGAIRYVKDLARTTRETVEELYSPAP